jgi:hypothetical protein
LAYREEAVNVQKANKYIGIRWMNVLCIIAVLILQVISILKLPSQCSLAEAQFHTPPRTSLVGCVTVRKTG